MSTTHTDACSTALLSLYTDLKQVMTNLLRQKLIWTIKKQTIQCHIFEYIQIQVALIYLNPLYSS